MTGGAHLLLHVCLLYIRYLRRLLELLQSFSEASQVENLMERISIR